MSFTNAIIWSYSFSGHKSLDEMYPLNEGGSTTKRLVISVVMVYLGRPILQIEISTGFRHVSTTMNPVNTYEVQYWQGLKHSLFAQVFSSKKVSLLTVPPEVPSSDEILSQNSIFLRCFTCFTCHMARHARKEATQVVKGLQATSFHHRPIRSYRSHDALGPNPEQPPTHPENCDFRTPAAPLNLPRGTKIGVSLIRR